MRHSKPAWLAWTLCALGIVLALYGLALSFRTPGADLAALAITSKVLNAGFTVVFGAVGALIVGRQPRNTIGWLLMEIALSLAFLAAMMGYQGQSGISPAEPTLANLFIAWFNAWAWWLLMGPLLLILLLFPTGRLLSPRWKWVVVALAVTFAVFLLGATFSSTFTLNDTTPPLRNPLGFLPDTGAQIFLVLFLLSLGATAFCSLAAIFVRYRRAGAVEREQLKWFLYACAWFGVVIVLQIFHQLNAAGGSNTVDVYSVLFDLGILGIPISIGIAILRYRLWDIDIIVRRTLVYAVLTVLLALVYFGSIVVLQKTFGALTGQRQSALETVLSTLVIAALFVPLRRRVQGVIDRRFYRRKYDAARTLAAFGSELRDETNLEALTRRLVNVVDDALQPEAVALWLKPAVSGGPRAPGPGEPVN